MSKKNERSKDASIEKKPKIIVVRSSKATLGDDIEKLIATGAHLLQIGDYKNASRYYAHSVQISRKKNDKNFELISLMGLAAALGLSRQLQEALEVDLIGLKLSKEMKRIKEIKLFSDEIGKICMALQKWEMAIEYYKETLEIVAKTKDFREESIILEEIGKAYKHLGLYDKAIGNLKESIEVSKKINDLQGISSCLVELGIIFQSLKRFQDAIFSFEKSLELDIQQNDEKGQLGDLNNLGMVYSQMKNFERSSNYYKKALELARKLNNKVVENTCLINMGLDLMESGKLDESYKQFEEALQLAQNQKNPNSECKILKNMGVNLTRLDKLEEAISYFEKSLELANKLNDRDQEIEILHNLGVLYRRIGKIDQAKTVIRQALELLDTIFTKIKDENIRIKLREKYNPLVENLISTFFLQFKTNSKIDQDIFVEFLCEIDYFKTRELMEKIESKAKIEDTKIAEKKEQIVKEIINLTSQVDNARNKAKDLLLEGKKGNLSLEEFKEAIKPLETEKNKLMDRINNLKEELFEINLDWEYQSPPYSGRTVIFKRIREFIGNLDIYHANFGIIEFVRTSNELGVIFISNKGEIMIEVLNYTTEKYGKIINEYLKVFFLLRDYLISEKEKYLTSAEGKLEALSKKFYSILIPPKMAKFLQQNELEILIVIPHAELQILPFELFNDGNEYWGLKYAISKCYSLDLLRNMLKNSRTHIGLEKSVPLLIANPNINDEIDAYSLALPSTENEVQSISNIIKSTTGVESMVLMGEHTTKRVFLEMITSKPFNLIHFAGHSYFDVQKPMNSFLMFSGYPKSGDHSILKVPELISKIKSTNPAVVILSACETGLINVAIGDEPFGLISGLIRIGATSIVLSNWSTFDATSKDFMIEFYRNWFAGSHISIALQEARKLVKIKTDSDNRGQTLSLLSWASFSLYGDPFCKVKGIKMKPYKIDQLIEMAHQENQIIRGLPKNKEGLFGK